jgi:hypothetical protein
MQKIITETDLRIAILDLKIRQDEEGLKLKEQFLVVYENVKPINLIKSTFREAAGSGDLQDTLINSTFGISAGYISKLLFQGISGSPIKKILGTALMFGVKNLVAQNPEVVKSIGKGFFKMIRKTMGDKDKETQHSESSETAAI